MGEFRYEGHRIAYDSYGEGERVLVLVHGLLMNRRMFERLGPELAAGGTRVICVDLLGHGRSDRPEDLRLYSMPLFARQVVALLDHLELALRRGGRDLARRQRRPRAGGALPGARARPLRRDAGARQRPARGRRSLHAGTARPALRPARLRAGLARHLAAAAHQLPGRHRARLGAPAPRSLRRRARGPAAGRDGAAPGKAARDRAADPDRRPSRATRCTPSATPACSPKSSPTPAWSRPARSSSGG